MVGKAGKAPSVLSESPAVPGRRDSVASRGGKGVVKRNKFRAPGLVMMAALCRAAAPGRGAW